MATENLALAFLAVGAAGIVFGYEWLRSYRARLQTPGNHQDG